MGWGESLRDLVRTVGLCFLRSQHTVTFDVQQHKRIEHAVTYPAQTSVTDAYVSKTIKEKACAAVVVVNTQILPRRGGGTDIIRRTRTSNQYQRLDARFKRSIGKRQHRHWWVCVHGFR